MNTPRLLTKYKDAPPTCLHILGQSLVTNLWKEGRELLKRNEQLEEQVKRLEEIIQEQKDDNIVEHSVRQAGNNL